MTDSEWRALCQESDNGYPPRETWDGMPELRFVTEDDRVIYYTQWEWEHRHSIEFGPDEEVPDDDDLELATPDGTW